MKDDRFYLLHIRDAIADVRSYAEAGREAFFGERMRQDGVIRKLEVIGEAVKGLSADTRARFPDIPWRQIAGMRDKPPGAPMFWLDVAAGPGAKLKDLPRATRARTAPVLRPDSNNAHGR